MIDIQTYRSRIGLFSPKMHSKKFLKMSEYYRKCFETDDQSGRISLSILKTILKIILILVFLQSPVIENARYVIAGKAASHVQNRVPSIAHGGVLGGQLHTAHVWSAAWSGAGRGSSVGSCILREENYQVNREIVDHNFQARSLNGNISNKKGIINMHLNIR